MNTTYRNIKMYIKYTYKNIKYIYWSKYTFILDKNTCNIHNIKTFSAIGIIVNFYLEIYSWIKFQNIFYILYKTTLICNE